MAEVDPTKLPVGTVLRWTDSPYLHVIKQRNLDNSGWWLESSGGLHDDVIREDEWSVVGVLWDPKLGDDPLAAAEGRVADPTERKA